ncbi:MAG: glucose-1-phosphate adenylyltransferase subunit GlgD [Clostridia bacterium]|nr:glucose-1-phosphate adenylyltransferase subunit GlgD [Clostridia bacterium]
MKNSIMGIIYTGERDQQLRELTTVRAVAAVPLCSRYRLIDFPLSSMVDSGIRNVGVIMQRNYNSLMDHLGSGKEWDLHGKHTGLQILPPFTTNENVGLYAGFLDAIRSNLNYLRRSKEKYTVITDTHMLYTTRFDDMAAAHEASGADITLLYTRDPGVRRNGGGRYLSMDENGVVTQLEVDPASPRLDATYMEAFMMEREKLIEMVDTAVSRGQYHLTRDVLMQAISTRSFKVVGFECTGKVWHLDSVQAYFECNMDLLSPETRAALFPADRPILTKLRDEMPTRYFPGATVKNSLLADGCVIEGTVENCVLFRGVRIAKGAVVRNSIIMQDGVVSEGAELDNCILDKQTLVRPNSRLIAPRSYPIVIAKQMTV